MFFRQTKFDVAVARLFTSLYYHLFRD